MPPPTMITSSLTACPQRSFGAWAMLAPQAKSLLRGAVGKAEQHGVRIGRVCDFAPRRRDEHVVRVPLEGLCVDAAAPAPFDHAVHCAVSRTEGFAAKILRQQLHERAYGRHRITAACGIHVLQLEPVARVTIAAAAQLLERFTRARVRVAEERRRERLRR